MFCPNCGKEVRDGDLFCTACGTRLTFRKQPEPQEWPEEPAYEEEPQEYQEEPVYEEEPYYDDEEPYYEEPYYEEPAPAPKKKLPIWALILIIVGGVVVIAAIVLALFFFVLKGRIPRPSEPATEYTTEAPAETTTKEVPTEATTAQSQTKLPKKMYTTAHDGLLLREGPGKQYTAIYLINYGTEITVDDIDNNWAHTQIAGLSGWCSCDYLTEDPPATQQETTTAASGDPNTLVYPDTWIDYGYHGYVNTTDGLYFRQGPGTNYAIIDLIPYGTEVAEEGYDGDWIFIKYNGRYGWVNSKYITASGGMAKPAIYLYPEEKTDVSVDVKLSEGKFTRTAPLYQNGWQVTAYPDGTLLDKETGKEYSYIYWESDSEPEYDWTKGYVVAGSETRDFLLEILPQMGLIPEEYNDFIDYWQPRMQKNAFNLITFQTTCYTDNAQMVIDPQPDSVLRIFMAYKAVDGPVDVTAPEITPFERKGFTVVEWGGAEVQ